MLFFLSKGDAHLLGPHEQVRESDRRLRAEPLQERRLNFPGGSPGPGRRNRDFLPGSHLGFHRSRDRTGVEEN